MALGTDFNKNVLAQGGLGLYYVAAATGSFHGFVFWMNFGFHVVSSQLMSLQRPAFAAAPHRLYLPESVEYLRHIGPGACILTEKGKDASSCSGRSAEGRDAVRFERCRLSGLRTQLAMILHNLFHDLAKQFGNQNRIQIMLLTQGA